MNHRNASCGHSVIAIGAPNSTAAKIQETTPCEHCLRLNRLEELTPGKIDEVITFDAQNKRFSVKKIKATCWCLWKHPPAPFVTPARMRWGNRQDIQDDLSFVLDIGELPPRSKGRDS